MDDLREVQFDMPLPILLKAGGSTKDSKRLTMTERSHDKRGTRWDAFQFTSFLKDVIKFTGLGLTEFSLQASEFIDSWSAALEDDKLDALLDDLHNLYCEVMASWDTLKVLKIGIHSQALQHEALQMVVSCRELSHLDLWLFNTDQLLALENYPSIDFPEDALPSKIKHLDLSLNGIELDWESNSLLNWFGKDLETLSLMIGNWCQAPPYETIPISSLTRILNSNSDLKNLRLSWCNYAGTAVTKR